MRQMVYELHTLLEKAGERPPDGSSGQSFGGVLVRLYSATYPDEVAGMVLVDGGRLNPLRLIGGELVSLPEDGDRQPVPAVKTSGPLGEGEIPADARAQIEAGRGGWPRRRTPRLRRQAAGGMRGGCGRGPFRR